MRKTAACTIGLLWRVAGSRPSHRRKRAQDPALRTSTPPPQSSIWRRRLPDRASSTRPRCFMPRRSVSNDASRSRVAPLSPASANNRAIRHQVSGVWISRDLSAKCSSPQQLGRQLRCTSTCRPGTATWASERMASTAFRKANSWPVSSVRQAQLDLEAVAQADSDQHTLGQQPGSAIENGGRATRPHVEAGRVDHQH